MCHLVEASIVKVLDENDNAASLLELHGHRHDHMSNDYASSTPTRSIKIK